MVSGYGVRLIPDDLGLSQAERQEVLRASWRRWAHGWRRFWGTLLVLGAIVVGLFFLKAIIADLLRPVLPNADRYTVYLLPLGMWIAIEIVVMRIGLTRCIYAELRARGHELCARCGYRLDGQTREGRVCPECGTVDGPVV